MGGWGQVLYSCVFDLPSKKSSLQKIFGFRILNLTLQSREARGVPQNAWFSLAHAKENASEKNLISTMVSLYTSARTHFSRNRGV
jgi:hypothetical protein